MCFSAQIAAHYRRYVRPRCEENLAINSDCARQTQVGSNAGTLDRVRPNPAMSTD